MEKPDGAGSRSFVSTPWIIATAVALLVTSGCEETSSNPVRTIGGHGSAIPGPPPYDETVERGGPSPDDAPWGEVPAPATELRFMGWPTCVAGSKIEDETALGGFGPSENFPKKVEAKKALESGRCYLLAEPHVTLRGPRVPGMRLTLVNGADRITAFDAADSHPFIVQEALDEHGAWRPLEAFPPIWCGNSYHRVLLGPGEYWQFATPRYAGDFATKLRFRLSDAEGNLLLLSNEFEGSVNPEQFEPRSAGESL